MQDHSIPKSNLFPDKYFIFRHKPIKTVTKKKDHYLSFNEQEHH